MTDRTWNISQKPCVNFCNAWLSIIEFLTPIKKEAIVRGGVTSDLCMNHLSPQPSALTGKCRERGLDAVEKIATSQQVSSSKNNSLSSNCSNRTTEENMLAQTSTGEQRMPGRVHQKLDFHSPQFTPTLIRMPEILINFLAK